MFYFITYFHCNKWHVMNIKEVQILDLCLSITPGYESTNVSSNFVRDMLNIANFTAALNKY